MHFTYHGFWASFYDEDKSAFKSYVESLFRDIPLSSIKHVKIHSVFECNKTAPIKEEGVLNVAFSGEVYFDDPMRYDLNLVMDETSIGARIVYTPLFAVGSYELNLWDAYERPRIKCMKNKFCAFVVSNPKAPLRNAMFHILSRYKRVDSWGAVFNNNGGITAPHDYQEYFAFLSSYKFMLCFENASNPWYITEKLYNAWLGGTIPIYWGCTQVKEFLNPKAFLYLEDETQESIDKLIQQVIELDNDDDKYNAMFNEPLFKEGGIHPAFDTDNIRKQIRQILIDKSWN